MDDLISRQAAIDVARKCSVKEVTPAYMLIDKAEVMTELMMLPSAQPTQPNTPNTLDALDCISRQDAVDIINGYEEQFNGYIGTPNDSEVYAYARGLLLSIERNISALLSAQPERKKGKWIYVNGHTAINCSACYHCGWSLSFEDTVKRFNFCPSCGADMRGEQE